MLTENPRTSRKITESDKIYAMFIHLSAILFGVFGPLLMWLLKKDDSKFIHRHGVYVLNFQLSLLIYSVGAFVLCFFVIGFFILPLLPVFNLVCSIIGALKAANGKAYKYPLCLQFVK